MINVTGFVSPIFNIRLLNIYNYIVSFLIISGTKGLTKTEDNGYLSRIGNSPENTTYSAFVEIEWTVFKARTSTKSADGGGKQKSQVHKRFKRQSFDFENDDSNNLDKYFASLSKEQIREWQEEADNIWSTEAGTIKYWSNDANSGILPKIRRIDAGEQEPPSEVARVERFLKSRKKSEQFDSNFYYSHDNKDLVSIVDANKKDELGNIQVMS